MYFKIIKNLQQRLNDMKKTLQKEFKYQSFPNESLPDCGTTLVQEKNSNELTVNKNKPNAHNNSSNKMVNSSNIQAIKPQKQINNLKSTLNEVSFAQASNQFLNKNNSQLSYLHDDVNFKYLKHVVLKFLTTREYEVSFSLFS